MWPLVTPVMLAGLPGSRVVIGDTTAFDLRLQPTNAVAEWEANSDGSARKFTGSGGYVNLPGQWKHSGLAADYEIRFTPASGDPPNVGSALNTWLSLSTRRYIRLLNTDDFESEKSGTTTVEIRDAITTTVLDTATVTLTAFVVGTA